MKNDIESLKKIANEVRKDVIKMVYNASSGHPGGSLSSVEILVALYHEIMDLSLDNNGQRIDKFILSKGHAAPVYYATLASKGYILKEDLKGFRKIDGFLEGHPTNKINGIDVSSGSLGQGLSIANGMAIAKKLDNKKGYVYCLIGDGESEEGQIWEALMTSNKYNLNNLIIFLDYNGLQIDGTIEEVKKQGNFEEKFKAFGLYTQVIDGNDLMQIINAVENSKKQDKPSVIICKTIKGKGISFMENKANWHGKAPNEEEYKKAMNELEVNI